MPARTPEAVSVTSPPPHPLAVPRRGRRGGVPFAVPSRSSTVFRRTGWASRWYGPSSCSAHGRRTVQVDSVDANASSIVDSPDIVVDRTAEERGSVPPLRLKLLPSTAVDAQRSRWSTEPSAALADGPKPVTYRPRQEHSQRNASSIDWSSGLDAPS